MTPGQLDLLEQIANDADPQDAKIVEQAIRAVAARGVPFSANAVRPLLPVLKSNAVVGACFTALKKAGVIRRHGREYVPSTDPRTHCHPIAVWIAA